MQGNSAIDKQNDPILSSKQSSKTCGGIFHTLNYNIIIERVPEKKATTDFVINYRVADSFSPITFVALVHAPLNITMYTDFCIRKDSMAFITV